MIKIINSQILYDLLQDKGSFYGFVSSKWFPADSMSTLSGIAAKGEKGKQKYVSLDINSKFLKNKVNIILFI